MGLDVGGYTPIARTGPSLLIAACLILAIRTAKWTASHDEKLSNHDLDREIDCSIHFAGAVLSRLLARKDAISPQNANPGISQTTRTFQSDS